MKLSSVLAPERIKLGLSGSRKADVIAELCDLAVASGRVHDRDEVLRLFYAREELKSTGIGHGVAIPHAQSDSVEGIVVALGVSRRDIDYDALDHQPVHIVFLIAAESHQSIPYLSLLSRISRLMRKDDLRARLIDAGSPGEALAIIEDEERDW
ncbi:PTS sugar transporter subunit IIA [bacterium]|nr:PTS sugar transporter subunit IIA [bacterium]